jgi:glycosyltransferase involved in cell wall biosynthesis
MPEFLEGKRAVACANPQVNATAGRKIRQKNLLGQILKNRLGFAWYLSMKKNEPEIGLVVCTKNRGDKLEPFFEAVKKIQCSCAWELIIVDNGSTDKTGQYLQAFAAAFPGQIKVITEFQGGLGRARNRGWRVSTAPVIVFTDDDCYPDLNFLNDAKTVFADEALGFSGGRILLYDPSDALITINESLDEKFLQPGEFIGAGFIQGANMAFRRQALMDINGFDENLGAGTPFACEDVDAALRVLAAGWKGKHDPRPFVYHHHRRKPGMALDSIWRTYDVGRGAYYMKCLLFLPQRRLCARHWLKFMRHQPLGRTLREVRSAVCYFFYQLKRKPNVTY